MRIRFVQTFAILIVLAALLPSPSLGQGTTVTRRNDVAFTTSATGKPVFAGAGAPVRVCANTGSYGNNVPCTPLATIYTDSVNNVPAPNPFNADASGNFHIYAATGCYLVETTIDGQISDQPDYCFGSNGSSSGGGMADPGANGIMKRTALNVTNIANANDVASLWGSCSAASPFLTYTGLCGNPPILPSGPSGTVSVNTSTTQTGYSDIYVTTSSGGDVLHVGILGAGEVVASSIIGTLYGLNTLSDATNTNNYSVSFLAGLYSGGLPGSGTPLTLLVTHSNTGAVTLSISGWGTFPVKKLNSSGALVALTGSELVPAPGANLLMFLDNADGIQLLSTAGGTSGGGYPGVTSDGNNGLVASGNIAASGVQVTGTNAGAYDMAAGTANPTIASGNVGIEAPSSVSAAYRLKLPSTPFTGIFKGAYDGSGHVAMSAAAASDVATLWASGSCGTQYMKGDGSCGSPSGAFSAGGDLSGTSSSQTVGGLQGHALPSLVAGYLNWTGSAWALSATSGGLADPGSNGILKRTALNTTATVAASDVANLWASGACGTAYMRGDGTCGTPSGGSALTMPYVNKTSSATLTATDFSNGGGFYFTCSSSCTATLPASGSAPSGGQCLGFDNAMALGLGLTLAPGSGTTLLGKSGSLTFAQGRGGVICYDGISNYYSPTALQAASSSWTFTAGASASVKLATSANNKVTGVWITIPFDLTFGHMALTSGGTADGSNNYSVALADGTASPALLCSTSGQSIGAIDTVYPFACSAQVTIPAGTYLLTYTGAANTAAFIGGANYQYTTNFFNNNMSGFTSSGGTISGTGSGVTALSPPAAQAIPNVFFF